MEGSGVFMKNWEGSDKLWMYFFDSIYYIVQLIFNFFRFLIIWGYDTIVYNFVSIYDGRKTTIIFTQTILHCDRIFFSYYWFKLQFIQYVYLLPPFLYRFFSCIRRQNLISKAFKNIFVLFSKQTKLIFLSIECQILTLNLIFDKFICIHHVLWFMKSK